MNEWVDKLLETCGTDAATLRRTLLVGHSCGAQAVFRTVPLLPHHIAGIVGVAPWLAIDKPWPAVLPWLLNFPSYERIHAKCRRVLCLVSDNDPFTKDYEKTTKALEEKTGALVILVRDGKHFTRSEEDEVFKRILAMARIIVDPLQGDKPDRGNVSDREKTGVRNPTKSTASMASIKSTSSVNSSVTLDRPVLAPPTAAASTNSVNTVNAGSEPRIAPENPEKATLGRTMKSLRNLFLGSKNELKD